MFSQFQLKRGILYGGDWVDVDICRDGGNIHIIKPFEETITQPVRYFKHVSTDSQWSYVKLVIPGFFRDTVKRVRCKPSQLSVFSNNPIMVFTPSFTTTTTATTDDDDDAERDDDDDDEKIQTPPPPPLIRSQSSTITTTIIDDDEKVIKYSATKIIGKGAFGTVYAGYSKHPKSSSVAIKVCHFDLKEEKKITHDNDRLIFSQELYILQLLKGQPGFVQMIDYWFMPNPSDPTALPVKGFLVMKLYTCNLVKHLQNSEITISQRIKYAYQMLQAVKVLQTIGITHCDIKPDNFLYDKDTDEVVLADFGLACIERRRKHAVTRWYRPPEIEHKRKYDTKVDSFSIGCSIAELFLGHVLIYSCCSNYSKCKLKRSHIGTHEFLLGEVKRTLDRKDWFIKNFTSDEIKFENEEQISHYYELMRGLLEMNPRLRKTAAEALKNPLFTSLKRSDKTVYELSLDRSKKRELWAFCQLLDSLYASDFSDIHSAPATAVKVKWQHEMKVKKPFSITILEKDGDSCGFDDAVKRTETF